jgi:hypothetical protein
MPLSVVDSKESLDVADAPAKRGPRLNRPRSAKACQYCRSRKVRCDWVANGNPCTNCRLDSRHCITVPRKQQISRPRQHGKERRRKFKPMNRGAATSTLPTPSPSGSDRVESASPDSFVQSPVASEGIEADLPNYLSHGDSKYLGVARALSGLIVQVGRITSLQVRVRTTSAGSATARSRFRLEFQRSGTRASLIPFRRSPVRLQFCQPISIPFRKEWARKM